MAQREANSAVLDQIVSGHIVSRDPERMSGAPVFAGTRVPIKALTDILAAGHPLAEFYESFPTVEPEQAVEFLRRVGEMVETGELTV